MIPSKKVCFDLMKEYKMLDNIRAHSIVVEWLARYLGQKLIKINPGLSLEMISAGALLHDIGKTHCLGNGKNHADFGEHICLKHHLEEIAPIVGEHIHIKSYDAKGLVLEKEIVYYADKRVKHDRIVSLDERFVDLRDRYGKNSNEILKRIQANFELSREVEQKIFSKMDIEPEDICNKMIPDPA